MSFFAQAKNVIVSGGTFIAQSTTPSPLRLFSSKIAPGALYDTAGKSESLKCYPETRKAILQHVMDWLRDADPTPSSSSFMWIYGPAGVGKTAIAQSIADMCLEANKLAATFFFARTVARCNSDKFFVSTLAYQMMASLPEMRGRALQVIEDDPSVFYRSLVTQMDELIIGPLNHAAQDTKNGPTRPTSVIIIDGLDECNDPESRERILRVLQLCASRVSIRLLFLITSRYERSIRDAFNEKPLSSATVIINIHKFSSDIDKDIKTFLQSRFGSIKLKHPAKSSIMSTWPSDTDISHLVTKSSGQFIYASTIMKYLESPHHSPAQRLTQLLAEPKKGDPFAELDAFYHRILSEITSTDLDTLLKVLGVVFLGELGSERTTPRNVEYILYLEPGTVQIALNDLHSLLDVPADDSKRIHIYHASFPDFLLDRRRSGNFHLAEKKARKQIARGIMKRNFTLEVGFDLMESFMEQYAGLYPLAPMLVKDLYSFHLTGFILNSPGTWPWAVHLVAIPTVVVGIFQLAKAIIGSCAGFLLFKFSRSCELETQVSINSFILEGCSYTLADSVLSRYGLTLLLFSAIFCYYIYSLSMFFLLVQWGVIEQSISRGFLLLFFTVWGFIFWFWLYNIH